MNSVQIIDSSSSPNKKLMAFRVFLKDFVSSQNFPILIQRSEKVEYFKLKVRRQRGFGMSQFELSFVMAES
jgi:hypothetical protein